jgi:hypothetical protein
MNYAIARAWKKPIDCLTVHTCTLDHPQALHFYLRSGLRPCKREIEIADDPRLTMGFRSQAAPHVPLLRCGAPPKHRAQHIAARPALALPRTLRSP